MGHMAPWQGSLTWIITLSRTAQSILCTRHSTVRPLPAIPMIAPVESTGDEDDDDGVVEGTAADMELCTRMKCKFNRIAVIHHQP